MNTRRNHSRLLQRYRIDCQSALGSRKTHRTFWVRSKSFLSLLRDTFKYRSICALSVQSWFQHQWARGDSGSGEKVPTRKGMWAELSTKGYVVNTTSEKFCPNVSTWHYVYIVAVFWRHGFVLLRKASAVNFMKRGMDVTVQLTWCESVPIF